MEMYYGKKLRKVNQSINREKNGLNPYTDEEIERFNDQLQFYNDEENYKVKKEYINIKLNENLNYNIKKGDIVNIYYTSKDKSKLILENIEIINSYNKEGIESNKNITQILIGINGDDVSIINSLKEGGLFDISIVKK